MIFGTTFEDYTSKHKLGEWITCPKTKDYHFELSETDFHFINNLGLIFNGMDGGLILGNLHKDGGIHLLSPIFETNTYKYVGEMEGWEYLTKPLKSKEIHMEFAKINELTKPISPDIETDFKIPENCNVVDTSNREISFLMLNTFPQFILNRFATKKHIHLILDLEIKNTFNY
ncbi:hypothetical protein [Lutibacter sp.]|uniref:hypothetical protein n=1 Tax=Lutibacter sp. TaxID=1925666 RepID=UPI001A2E9F3A|nr:hypothetical protein [Lutibacter sp.]MBI9042756.1 hypothetical protein [Lutibacter sp.]